MQFTGYGIDAPPVVRRLLIGGVAYLLATLLCLLLILPRKLWVGWTLSGFAFSSACFYLLTVAMMLYSSLAGKKRVIAALLDQLSLRGDEKVLDAGCGRGMLLVELAKRLPQGRVDGVDLWRKVDQSGNAFATTRAHLEREGLSERVHLTTGDIRALPYEDGAFDLVISSLVVHNIKSTTERARALTELVRVLKTNGRLVLIDIQHTREYQRVIETCGLTVKLSRPNFRMFPPVRLLVATKS